MKGVEEIVRLFADELENWNFFSDGQRAYMENGHIIVCLRNYNWYITKEPIIKATEAIKALFEVMWIAEYEDSEEENWVDGSKYWRKLGDENGRN